MWLSRRVSRISSAACWSGSLVPGLTISQPMYRPAPRTSPMPGVCRHKRRDGILEYCADLLGVAHGVFVTHHVKHRLGRGHAYRVAAESVEVRNGACERFKYFVAGGHHRRGQTVGHGLAGCDQIGNNALASESPECVAGASEARLHFVAIHTPPSS